LAGLLGSLGGGGSGGNMLSPELMNVSYSGLIVNPASLFLGFRRQQSSLESSAKCKSFDMSNILQVCFQVNPSVFLNPRVMNAMMQIQQATQVIVQEAPELAQMMNIPRNLPGMQNTASTTSATTNPPTSGTSTTAGNRNLGGMMDFASMLQQMNIVSNIWMCAI
jgi:hypothetical protein